MMKETLVIGSTGYLGQRVAQLLAGRSKTTYRTAPKFPDSLHYDFYADTQLPIDASKMTVIFTAAVEMNKPIDKLEAGMKHLLDQLTDARFIYISSDAVFNGESGNYTEAERPVPANGYGQNLVLCEELVQSMVANSCIIRPSYIYGFLDGQLDLRLSRTRDALLRGEEYSAYEDYFKSPLSVHEVADAVVSLAESDYRGPIHVAGLRMSAYDFQRRAMDALGVERSNLHPIPMPTTSGLMRDTSLDSSKWWTMCESQPLSIEEGLRIQK